IAAGWTIVLPNATFSGATHYLFYINPLTRVVEFAIGVGIGIAFLRRPSRPSSSTAEIAVVLFSVMSVLLITNAPPAFAASLAVIPASAVMIYVFSRGGGLISSLLSHRLPVLLGD